MAGEALKRSQRRLRGSFWWLVLVLAIVAGSVDGIGYILLAHIFTSHMSGNTVAVTLHVASGNWKESWRHFEPIVAFVLGIIAGLVVADVLAIANVERIFGAVAAVEVAFLAVFLALDRPHEQWMILWPAAAMGVQNALIRRAGHHNVRTTFVTGMLTNTAHEFVEGCFLWMKRDSDARKHFRDFGFYAGIWACFAGGGIAGASIVLGHGPVALALPIALLLFIVGMDIAQPLTEGSQAS